MNDPGHVTNFASLVLRHQTSLAGKTALVFSAGKDGELAVTESVTFGEIATRIHTLAGKLRLAGFRPGDRIMIGIPVSVSLYTLVLATMAIGAIPVLIDPGFNLKQAYYCLQTVKPKGIISARPLTKWRYLLPVMWPIRKTLTFAQLNKLAAAKSKQPIPEEDHLYGVVPAQPDQTALITFTSGSSGKPKGVNRTHSILINQYQALKAHFPPLPDQVDMPAFPVLTLYNLCCGFTTIMPVVNFKAVSKVNPELIVKQIRQSGVNTLSGPPVYLDRITTYCLANNLVLPEIKGLAVGGAPVGSRLASQILAVFPNAEAHILYGSSEAEPVASILISDFLKSERQKHKGYLVGRPADSVQLKIIADNQEGELPAQDLAEPFIGEIIVTGSHVCKYYFRNAKADKAHKIQDTAGTIWHRTGDLGFMDTNGQLWLTGRLENCFKIQQKTVYPFQVERVIETGPAVGRAAVVGDKTHSKVIIFLENTDLTYHLEEDIRKALLEKFGIRNLIFKAFPKLPVDKRHQSKIDYPALQKMAESL